MGLAIFCQVSTLAVIQEAVTRLRDAEKRALSLWLDSQTIHELSAEDEQRLLRSLDDALREVEAGKGVQIEDVRKRCAHGLQNNFCAPGHRRS